jgi:hypothetical protein
VGGSFAFTTPTTVPTAGTDSEGVTFTPTDTTDYSPVTGTVNVVVAKATPTITWPTATSIAFGQTLASSTLNGGSALNGSTVVAGTFAFTTPTTAPPTGTNAQSVTFTPTDTTDYNPVTGTVNVTVTKGNLTITWPTASAITYGQTLASSTLTGGSALNGTTTVAGTFVFTTPTLVPTAGTDSESVTFTPTDTTDYSATTGSVTVVVNKTAPTVTWPTASGIIYGQTLASSILTGGSALNGTTTVAGTFTFTTPTTAPTAGTDPESVTFTPTDTTDYSPVTGTVNVVVAKATPTVTWPTASSIVYGETLASSTLTGGSALNGTTTVAGAFAFTTPTTVPAAGTDTESVTFTPTDTADYNPVTGSVSVTVTKGSLTITWPTASAITFGQTLASSTLTGGSALNGTTSVAGTFAFTTPTTAPTAGTHAESVTFTPTDTTDYSAVTGTVNVTVNKASLTVTWPTASAITYGQTLASSTLTGGSALSGTTNVPGTFAFTTPTTAPTAGTDSESVTFTPTDSSDYNTATGSVSVVVNGAPPTLAWTPTATIAYGTSLSGLLNATASFGGNSVAGSFAYTAKPAGGTATTVTSATVLADGTYTLAVAFTPTDTTDYKTATATAPLTVTSQSLTVTASNATKVYGTANPTFTGTVTGAVNGDTFTESFMTTATTSSNVGTYSIVPSATGANISDYTVVIDDGTLTVTQAGTTTMLAASGTSVNPGSPLTLTATVASATTGSPTGTVTFYDGSTMLGTGPLAGGANGDTASFTTSALASGSHTITAVYGGDTNFTASSTTGSVTITVAPLGLTMTATPSTQTGNPGTTFTYQLAVAPAFSGTSYPAAVSFSVNGGPTGAVVSFTPSTLAANAGPQTVSMAIATSATSAAVQPLSSGRKLVPVALAFLLLPLAGTRRMRRNGQKLGRYLALLLLALAGIAATTALSGCGSSPGGTTTVSKGTQYTITVTATSGSASQTSTVTLTLQ